MEVFVFDRIFSRRNWPGLALTCAIMLALGGLFGSSRDWRGVVVFGLFAIFLGIDVWQYRPDFAGRRVLRSVHARGIVWVRFRQSGFLPWSRLSGVTVPDEPHSRGFTITPRDDQGPITVLTRETTTAATRFIAQRLAEAASSEAHDATGNT